MEINQKIMSKFVINGGRRLSGSIDVAGAKNAILPLLAATLLTEEECAISNVPEILDVQSFIKILKDLGCEVTTEARTVTVRCGNIKKYIPDKKLCSSTRASVIFMGALLSRLKKTEVVYPGGDKIGKRPINIHIQAFKSLGAKVVEGETVKLSGDKLVGTELFAESSVTGTENMVMASVFAKGKTIIKLAALEPHVQQLCRFLKKMGARINGIGTHTLVVEGVKKLHGAKVKVIPDMLEAGSFAVLAAASKSELTINNVDHSHLDTVYEKFREIGINFDKSANSLIILRPQKGYKAVSIRTGVYPSLATDLQPPFGVLATQCKGTTKIHDWIYEGRQGYLKELSKMGANVKIIDTHQAEVTGLTKLHPAKIESLDVRSGMTLVIASLIAEGKSVISGIHHIGRGYERLDGRLRNIGADIQKID